MLLLTLITGRSADYGLLTADRLFYLLASVWVGGGIGDTLYVRSMTHIGVSRAFPIASIYPSFTLLMSLFFLQEQIDLGIIAGLLLVVLGVILVGRRTPSVASETSTAGKPWGVLFALLAAICWGTSAVLIAPGARGLDSIMVASIRVPALSLLLWGVVAARRTAPKLRTLSRKEWLILVIGGFVGWGLGSMLFVLSIMLLGPTRSAILTSTSPLFALPLSVVFLKERVTWLTVIGTLLAVVGVILVS